MGMMEGMFSGFREAGAPSWYGEHRTPVVVDISAVIVAVSFGLVFLGFLLVVPGIRRQRLASAGAVGLCVGLGLSLVSSTFYVAWSSGYVDTMTHMESLRSQPIVGRLGVHFGLTSFNVSLGGYVSHPDPGTNGSHHHWYDFEEGFAMADASSVKKAWRRGLRQGLPFPITALLDVLSVQGGSITWGRDFRLAGYYASLLLWTALGLWCVVVVTLAVLPAYFSRALLLLAAASLAAHSTYAGLVPKDLPLHFPAQKADQPPPMLRMRFGWCFWACLVEGLLCLFVGALMRLLESQLSWTLVTFLQSDFDEVSGSPYRMGQAEKTKTAAEGGEPVRPRLESAFSAVSSASPNPDPVTPFARRKVEKEVGAKGGRLEPLQMDDGGLLTPGWQITPGRRGPLGAMESTRLGEQSSDLRAVVHFSSVSGLSGTGAVASTPLPTTTAYADTRPTTRYRDLEASASSSPSGLALAAPKPPPKFSYTAPKDIA